MTEDFSTPHSSRKWLTSNLTASQFIDLHVVECEQCSAAPLDCIVLQSIVDDLQALPVQTFLESRIARNPEYYKGTSKSPWFDNYN